jgi:tetratricopeptide (TPR) repeat protein
MSNFLTRSKNHLFRLLLILAGLSIISTSAHATGRWDWQDPGEAQTAFCDRYLAPVLELRKTQGTKAALAALEEIYQLSEKQFPHFDFFQGVIWFEAQVKGGKDDEEWGLAVFEYLLERGLKKNPEHAVRVPPNDYLLYGNIVEKNLALGRIAKVRSVCMFMEDSLKRGNFDTSGASYEDQGPVFSFLPEARKRRFPIFAHELSKSGGPEPEKPECIYYPYIYALGDVAASVQDTGDWVRAAELNIWSVRYADMCLQSFPFRRDEVGRTAGYLATKRLADIAILHGYPKEAATYLSDFVRKAEGYYKSAKSTVACAKLDLAVVRITTGELTDADLLLVDDAEKTIGAALYNDRPLIMMGTLNKARVYHALGRREEAWSIVNDLFARTEKDVNPYHRIEMLETAIDLALADGGTHPELEKWLVQALTNARQTGSKFREVPLYEKYARFLMMQGRYAEAVQIQQEAIRLSRAMNLPKRLQDNLVRLDGMKKQMEKLQRVATGDKPDNGGAVPQGSTDPVQGVNAPPVTVVGGSTPLAIDIQPRRSFSAALPAQPAYGRFYIHNPSTLTRHGELVLSGAIEDPQWDNREWLAVTASPLFEAVKLSHPLTLDAGATYVVDLTGLPREDGSGAEVKCEWVPDKGTDSATGTWTYQSVEKTAGTGIRTAVIDAHELQSNPYYLLPIHHMAQRLDTALEQSVDFTVAASQPTRIESYDAVTGKLLAIDANGDGDFLDSGDMIAADSNRNSWPELIFGKNQKLASLMMYVQPLGEAGGDVELAIKILSNGEWHTDALDVIKPYRPAER